MRSLSEFGPFYLTYAAYIAADIQRTQGQLMPLALSWIAINLYFSGF
jgi:hypothetical protein